MFHHMLLYYGNKFPIIKTKANAAIETFLKHPKYRYKNQCPDLGEWLVLLTLTNVPWTSVAIPFLQECFIRNVRWALRRSPQLKDTTMEAPERLRRTWRASLTSMRLIMFQGMFMNVYFFGATRDELFFFHSWHFFSYWIFSSNSFQVYFLSLVRPATKTIEKTLEDYNLSCGIPNNRLKTKLSKAVNTILNINSWK